MNIISKSFKRINHKLLFVIFTTMIIPVVYRTLRMNYIGSMPNDWSYSAAANIQWINVVFEVVDEAFLLPVFFSASLIIKNNHKKIFNMINTMMIIYIILSLIMILLTSPLLAWLSESEYNSTTESYIRFEFGNRVLVFLPKIVISLLIIKSKWKAILYILLLQMTLSVFLDTFMISQFNFSMNLGVMGIAYTTLIAGIITTIVSIYLLIKAYDLDFVDILIFQPFHLKRSIYREWLLSSSESFIRNAFFIWFVIKAVYKGNSNGEDPNIWWSVNSIIWDWMLLPVFALSRYIGNDIATQKNVKFWERYSFYFISIFTIIIFWIIFIPAYEPFARNVLNNENSVQIAKLIWISIGFYAMFAINEIADKTFFAKGQAHLMVIQGILTNIIVYLPFYYLVNDMTLEMIAIMFGTGILVDSIITMYMFMSVNRQEIISGNKLNL